MLKENTVMPGPIFRVFSLPPCWLYFLTGISGLAFSNLFRQFSSLKSYWSYLPPSLVGPVFSFFYRIIEIHSEMCCFFIHSCGALKQYMSVFFF